MELTPNHTIDVLVVGSGAAALAAAATAKQLGLRTLVIEQSDKIGGTTAYSGGTIWIPQNSVSEAAGCNDSRDAARRYLQDALAISGGAGPESTPARIDAFLAGGPAMTLSNPRLSPEIPGAMDAGGRTLDPCPFDAGTLGCWADRLRRPGHSAPVAYFHDFVVLTKPYASAIDLLTLCWMKLRAFFRSKTMARPTCMGSSLVAQLLDICLRKGSTAVQIKVNTKFKDLLVEGEAVCGAVVESKDSGMFKVYAHGILLAAGGFARREDLRREHLPLIGPEWTLTQPEGDTGDALEAACKVGAATSLMGEAWWIPTIIDPGSGRLTTALFELCKPHCIVVDRQGSRIFSEADPYGDVGRALYHRSRGDDNNAWLILDWNYRSRYTLGSLGPRVEPVDALARGHIFRADDLASLAAQIGVEAKGLLRTVETWNQACDDGVDGLFGKGRSNYHLFVGDRSAKRPNMGSLDQPPYYAIRVTPGDAGTKGGLLTDEYGRVVDTHGNAIDGLYAAGNSSASVMGATSLGAGVTLGPAMTFAHLAVLHMSYRQKVRGERGLSFPPQQDSDIDA
ncbi:FAD binding domain-containing protein [Colletotrichum godetiae]|uniref:FAD binding domain-containing protein n=1 Tax=Colletotrichum godetiae TaxID=1209918 RepID=A0AAJ0A5N0_9PEZI|nr:FAD binding domain-containing protein [Colletotrichum godetiae]KAK1656938.1 FAD binding domain-containing protein [Colletotrichum godetiae]